MRPRPISLALSCFLYVCCVWPNPKSVRDSFRIYPFPMEALPNPRFFLKMKHQSLGLEET